jgi:ADP-heptose:LPS heptosyltransferase
VTIISPDMAACVADVKKIAIIRANALGDFIVTLPAIYAVRAAYPAAEIILLGKPWHRKFLIEKRSPVDRVIVIPAAKGLWEEADQKENSEELERFFREIRKENLDIAIHFHGKGIAANPFLKKMGAKITVGMISAESEKIDRHISFYYYQPEVIRYLEIVSLIGAQPVMLEPVIKILPNDLEELSEFLGDSGNNSFAVLHPCGTDPRRMWQKEKFSKVADILSEKKLKVFFTGSAEDFSYVEEIIFDMKSYAVNACGKLSLGGTAALFSLSRIVIGIDTGPLHLARAAGARTVGLYWAPNVINWAPLTREKHRPVISWELHCPHCGIIPNDPYPFEPVTSMCPHQFSFIGNISVEEVISASENLLAEI